MKKIIILLSLIFLIACDGRTGRQYDAYDSLDSSINTPNGENNDNNESNESSSGGSGSNSSGGSEEEDDDEDDEITTSVCGQILEKRLKIANGTVCSTDSSPVAAIFVYTDADAYICSGTLIDTDVILTAGHCFKSIPSTETITQVITVVGGQQFSVKNYIINPNYNINAGVDTAVVVLDSDVTNVAPVPIITSTTPAVGKRIIIYGYGITQKGSWDGNLRAAYMQVASVASPFITADYDTTKTNACNGDSGGPAIMLKDGVAGIIGITSFGAQTSCLSGDITHFPLMSYSKNLRFIKKYASISTL